MMQRSSFDSAADNRHLLGLDLLRFFAAAAVMLFHLAYLDWALPGSTAYRLSGGHAQFPELAGIASFGWIGVQAFFVISGFVIAYSAENANLFSFVRSRVLRLLPAAWVCASLSLVAILLGSSETVSAPAFARSLSLWLWGPWVDPSYWTLGIEIVFYALVASLIAAGRFGAIRQLALLLGGLSAVYWLAWWLSFADPSGTVHQWLLRHRESRALELLLVHHGCFFALGVMLWSWSKKRQARDADALATWPWLPLLVAVCLMQIAAHHALAIEKTGIAAPLWPPLLAWLVAMAGMVAAIRYNDRIPAGPLARKLLRRVGLMTYPLYLLHQVVGCLLLGLLVAAGVNRFLALASSIVVLLALSNLVCSIFEPPVRALLKRGFSVVKTHAYS